MKLTSRSSAPSPAPGRRLQGGPEPARRGALAVRQRAHRARQQGVGLARLRRRDPDSPAVPLRRPHRDLQLVGGGDHRLPAGQLRRRVRPQHRRPGAGRGAHAVEEGHSRLRRRLHLRRVGDGRGAAVATSGASRASARRGLADLTLPWAIKTFAAGVVGFSLAPPSTGTTRCAPSAAATGSQDRFFIPCIGSSDRWALRAAQPVPRPRHRGQPGRGRQRDALQPAGGGLRPQAVRAGHLHLAQLQWASTSRAARRHHRGVLPGAPRCRCRRASGCASTCPRRS